MRDMDCFDCHVQYEKGRRNSMQAHCPNPMEREYWTDKTTAIYYRFPIMALLT